MDDQHKDNPIGAQQRAESVLEQRYKELYGNAVKPPDAEDAAKLADLPDEESMETAAIKEDPHARAAAVGHAARRPRAPLYDEGDEDFGIASEKPAVQKRASQPYPRKSAGESGGQKPGPGRRVDTLERSTARRTYGQLPKPQMKLWPWALAASVLVLALAGLLIYSLLRPTPAPQVAATAAPTDLPASFFGPTAIPTQGLPIIEPTLAPTEVPTEPPAGTTAPDTNTVLRPGTSGEAVKQMQRRLVELGYLAEGSSDGEYGSTTQSAVVEFQKAHNLTADGYAGQQTLTILYSAEALPAAAEE